MANYIHLHPQRHAKGVTGMGLHSQFQSVEPPWNTSMYNDAAAIFLIMKYYLVKIQYFTTVCMRHHQPIPLAKHVDAMEITHENDHA